MGQAKRRGSLEDRIVQAQARAQQSTQRAEQPSIMVPRSFDEISKLQREADRLFSNLTTPAEINTQVSQFSRMLSDKVPVYLDCHPEPWSRQSCCDANVAKYIEGHGGKVLCGYRIWYHEPLYIEGERHAIWTDGEVMRDVSFVDSGETKILFVPDDKGFDDAPAKVRHAFDELAKRTLAQYEAIEKMIPTGRLSPQEAWDIMPTYERWLAGERMPNAIPAAFYKT